jgi:hypothetical protein
VTFDHNVVWESFPNIEDEGSAGDIHIDFNTVLDRDLPSMVLACTKCKNSEASNNRIYTPITERTGGSYFGFPILKNNTSTAPGAGAIGSPGCSFASCRVRGYSPPPGLVP